MSHLLGYGHGPACGKQEQGEKIWQNAHCKGGVQVPEGVDWAAVVKNAMDTYSVEIAGGLGPTAGKVWRVGIMGYNARPQNVALVIESFRDGLKKQGKL